MIYQSRPERLLNEFNAIVYNDTTCTLYTTEISGFNCLFDTTKYPSDMAVAPCIAFDYNYMKNDPIYPEGELSLLAHRNSNQAIHEITIKPDESMTEAITRLLSESNKEWFPTVRQNAKELACC